jgi:hypothetical protein
MIPPLRIVGKMSKYGKAVAASTLIQKTAFVNAVQVDI